MTNFNYELIGDRNHPVILFLHGFMGDKEDFGAVISLISAEFCCLTVDLPGHGKTEVAKDSDYQMPQTAQGIIELLDSLKITQCFLVGYSMGGRVALYLTVYFPQYFIKVILESASPGLKTEAARIQRIQQDLKLIKQLQSGDFAQFLERWYSNPLFTRFRNHFNYQQAIARRLNNEPNKLAKSLQYLGLGVQPSLWEYLATIQPPVLLIVGEEDAKFIAINQQIANSSSQVQLQIVVNTDHNVHFEHPIQFAQLTKDFFALSPHK